MTQTATQYQTASDLMSIGASAPAFGGFNYLPVGQEVGGTVTLKLEDSALRLLAHREFEARVEQKLRNNVMPTGKTAQPARAVDMQRRGVGHYRALMTARDRKPGRYAALNAAPAKPAVKPEVAAKPAPALMAVPLTKQIQVSQLSVNPTRKPEPNRASLRLAVSNDVAPEHKAVPHTPSAFARRHEKLCQGMGAFNFG
jgi:hypothetical protein